MSPAGLQITQPISNTAALNLLSKEFDIEINAGVYGEGLLTVLGEDIGTTALNAWTSVTGQSLAILSTGFGEIFFWRSGVLLLDPQVADVVFIDHSLKWFLEDFLKLEEVKMNVLRKLALEQVVEQSGPLQYGSAFILTPWEIFGGVRRPENYHQGDLCIYLSLLAQTHGLDES